ncbi:uncharacterized protein LOC135828524 [Sycon ciliatum]|uniref:uncharacterized protein LOC135828524 n=1 Tax=Sycon ciliatum TaxID=27933 RepID=UPI0031F650C1
MTSTTMLAIAGVLLSTVTICITGSSANAVNPANPALDKCLQGCLSGICLRDETLSRTYDCFYVIQYKSVRNVSDSKSYRSSEYIAISSTKMSANATKTFTTAVGGNTHGYSMYQTKYTELKPSPSLPRPEYYRQLFGIILTRLRAIKRYVSTTDVLNVIGNCAHTEPGPGPGPRIGKKVVNAFRVYQFLENSLYVYWSSAISNGGCGAQLPVMYTVKQPRAPSFISCTREVEYYIPLSGHEPRTYAQAEQLCKGSRVMENNYTGDFYPYNWHGGQIFQGGLTGELADFFQRTPAVLPCQGLVWKSGCNVTQAGAATAGGQQCELYDQSGELLSRCASPNERHYVVCERPVVRDDKFKLL